MPIARMSGKLVYFAHVPRCGGSAVENYLHGRFGTLAFLDRGHLAHDPDRVWNRSSPQHVDAATFARLVPPDFFSASFAVVRHPVRRLESVFLYHRDVTGYIARNLPFADWLDQLPDRRRATPFHLDNHTRAMTDLVPDNARVFRLEDGLAPLVGWIDRVAGDQQGERDIKPVNVREKQVARLRKGEPDAELPAPPAIETADIARIHALFSADFERFGYAPDPIA